MVKGNKAVYEHVFDSARTIPMYEPLETSKCEKCGKIYRTERTD